MAENAASGLNNNYSVRTYNLTANIPQSLPSARQFMLISATVDLAAIGLSLGAQNADFDSLILGISVGLEEGSIKARILSNVTQVVVVAMVTGRAQIVDSRFAPSGASLPVTVADGADVTQGARADAVATTDVGTFSLIALIKRLLTKTNNADVFSTAFAVGGTFGAAFSTTVLVASGANTNGILLSSACIVCGDDTTALVSINNNATAIMQATDSRAIQLGAPITFPAGQQLAVNVTGRGSANGTYRIL